MTAALDFAVAELMRRVAAEVILPRFRNLSADEVEEKSGADDLVTVVDRASEARLAEGLAALDPGTNIVGEEGVAADPALLDGLNRDRHWLIDPLDGTGNFAAGRAPFGVLVALVEDGEPVAGWILDPVSGRLCHARRGSGAFVGDQRVQAHGTGATRPIVALSVFVSDADRARYEGSSAGVLSLTEVPRCAAEQYPRLGLGTADAALFQRTMPWDHAAGAIWLEEAGGVVRRLDGSPYRVGDRRTGLLAAATPALWQAAAQALGLTAER